MSVRIVSKFIQVSSISMPIQEATESVANLGNQWDLSQLELRYFPMLSRKVAVSSFSRVSTTKVNLIYTVARAVSHPNNYKGNPDGVKKLACGISIVPKDQLLDLLDIKQKHLYRLLSLGMSFGFWRRFSVADGWIFFSLRSPQNIAKWLGIDKVGSFAHIEPSDFGKIDILTTEMVALGQQLKTFHAAKLEAKPNNRSIYTSGQLVFGSASQRPNVPGKPWKLGQRYVAIDSKVQPYGITLERIAELTGKSYSTVQKHLDNTWREEHGVHRLPKVQLLKLTELTPDELEFHKDQEEDIDGKSPDQFLVNQGKVFYKSNNIYWDAAGFECTSFRTEDRERYQSKSQSPSQEADSTKISGGDSGDDSNQNPPEEGSINKGDKPPKKVCQLLRDWEEAKGVSHKPQFFESLDKKYRDDFLNSEDAFPYIDQDKNFVDPKEKVRSSASNDDVYIHVLDLAKAVSESFRGKKS